MHGDGELSWLEKGCSNLVFDIQVDDLITLLLFVKILHSSLVWMEQHVAIAVAQVVDVVETKTTC